VRPILMEEVLLRRLDAWLDEALEQTFPASDPIASPPNVSLIAPNSDDESESREVEVRAPGEPQTT